MPRPKDLQPIQIKGILEADIERLEKQKAVLDDLIYDLGLKCEEAHKKRAEIAFSVESELEAAKKEHKKAMEARAEAEAQLKIKHEVALMQGVLAKQKEEFSTERRLANEIEKKLKQDVLDFNKRNELLQKSEREIDEIKFNLELQKNIIDAEREELKQKLKEVEIIKTNLEASRGELDKVRESHEKAMKLLKSNKDEFEIKIREKESEFESKKKTIDSELDARKRSLDKKEVDLVRRERELDRNYEDFKVRIEQLEVKEAKAKK